VPVYFTLAHFNVWFAKQGANQTKTITKKEDKSLILFELLFPWYWISDDWQEIWLSTPPLDFSFTNLDGVLKQWNYQGTPANNKEWNKFELMENSPCIFVVMGRKTFELVCKDCMARENSLSCSHFVRLQRAVIYSSGASNVPWMLRQQDKTKKRENSFNFGWMVKFQ